MKAVLVLMLWMTILTSVFAGVHVAIDYRQNNPYTPDVPEEQEVSIPVFPAAEPITDAVQKLMDNLMLYLQENITMLPSWTDENG